ncbi:hypothetical protein [Chitinophaga pinensis]|uniref:Uncharacterized protein n=1 Tax=Chitinophaga pinensis (strain ATCC 43595 / DSM 2588 / LMG 13176 / NBRC 15968 / NCIMB 11800 / UQM 2034) TaxID=485918 RepID=A0A979G1T1_CHIPD|nr:hypothetical protein [Chitinophaga pinensis]ACU59259.1 conserved hypothetical protein [Chitinophaga pinensis DSM 2588]
MNRLLLFSLLVAACQSGTSPQPITAVTRSTDTLPVRNAAFDASYQYIHVFVALCDNDNQGIVPVPKAIGNGQDPDKNLYWGCGNGIRTYFKNSKEWTLVRKYRMDSLRLERLIFRHVQQPYYLVADAYDGRYIRQCTVDFLNSCAGLIKDTVQVKDRTLGINGNARLLAYIGHDGLMDFNLQERFVNTDSICRDAIILACISRDYFSPHLVATRARPLVWTTGLMCPEAYTLHDALSSYVRNESVENVRGSAAKAYAKYQRCSEKAAQGLLVSGWR